MLRDRVLYVALVVGCVSACSSTTGTVNNGADGSVGDLGDASSGGVGDGGLDAGPRGAEDAGDGDTGMQPCDSDADCNDALPCTFDRCSEGACSHVLRDYGCPDGSLCTPEGDCRTPVVCGSDAECVDDSPCTHMERCDAASATCAWDLLDRDGDGHVPVVCGGDDKNDAEPNLFPGAREGCDGLDNDEDGTVDEAEAADADCRGRGAVFCEAGGCRVCTEADVEWLMEMGTRWSIALSGCNFSSPDAEMHCYSGKLALITPECATCFFEYGETVYGCSGTWCICDNPAGLEALRECADGLDWTCGPT